MSSRPCGPPAYRSDYLLSRAGRYRARFIKLEGRGRRTGTRAPLPLSPGNLLPVPVETAGRIAREGRREDNRSGTDLDAPRCARASHVRSHPARADRVDMHLPGCEFAGEDPCERIHRDLRHRIRGRPARALDLPLLEGSEIRFHKRVECGTSQRRIGEPWAEIAAHGRQFPEPARNHDDAAAVRDEREEGIRHVAGSEIVRFDRPNRCAPIGAPGADARVVHEDVEAGRKTGEVLREGRDAPAVRDVELAIDHIVAFRVELPSDRDSFVLVATRQQDAESFLSQLDGRLEPQPTICAGDERRGTVRCDGWHDPRDRGRSLFSLWVATPSKWVSNASC